jgi:hypothetical protein
LYILKVENAVKEGKARMSYLVDRKTELKYKTATVVMESGKPKPVVVESRPKYAVVGLAGSRKKFPISWEQVYSLAERNYTENIRLEQEAAKKVAKEIRKTRKSEANSPRNRNTRTEGARGLRK